MENREKMENVQVGKKESSIVTEFEKQYLTVDIQKAASWFFWIAGLSLINSLIHYFNGDVYFIVGLAFTQFIDSLVSGLVDNASWIAIIPNIMIVGFFIFIGYRARNYDKWAFVVGVILYFFDGLLYLYFSSWMAVGFHVFALVMIGRGFFKVFQYDKANHQIKGEHISANTLDNIEI